MIDIILFAGIAALIGVKLYNVLGRKDFEPGKATVAMPVTEKAIDASYVVLKPVVSAEDDVNLENIFGKELAIDIRKIREVDPSFSAQNFLSGAKKAFEVILKAFSSGDKEALKPLLSKDVYKNFDSEIDARAGSDKIHETTLVAIISTKIKHIAIKNKYVCIATQIVSEQVNLIKDKHGKIIEGNPSQLDKIDEIWTFARDITSGNPNWELIETAAS